MPLDPQAQAMRTRKAEATSVDRYWRHYLNTPGDGDDPLAPPLRDQAERYADRVRADGVPVRPRRYPGMVGGFLTTSGVLDAARGAIAYAAAGLREAFAGARNS